MNRPWPSHSLATEASPIFFSRSCRCRCASATCSGEPSARCCARMPRAAATWPRRCVLFSVVAMGSPPFLHSLKDSQPGSVQLRNQADLSELVAQY